MWDKMARRERIVLSAGVILAVVILFVQVVFVPFMDMRRKLTKAIGTNERALKEMRVLETEYRDLKRGMDAVQSGLVRREPTFALFSWLEQKAGSVGVRSHIRNMQASKKPIPGSGYEESVVEVALEQITLRQLADFLQAVESPEELVRIRHLAVHRGTETPSYLSATIRMATIVAAGSEAKP